MTAQKPQFLVQCEPRIMKVAVGLLKHLPMLGHLASSQTVATRWRRRRLRVSCRPAVWVVLIQSGSLMRIYYYKIS